MKRVRQSPPSQPPRMRFGETDCGNARGYVATRLSNIDLSRSETAYSLPFISRHQVATSGEESAHASSDRGYSQFSREDANIPCENDLLK